MRVNCEMIKIICTFATKCKDMEKNLNRPMAGLRPLTIVKVGGAVVEDEAQLTQLLRTFIAIEGPKILVHGGGRRATKMAAQLGIETRMVEGRRITDAQMLEVVTMVYGGLVNKHVVASLQALGADAIGLTGADGDIIIGTILHTDGENEYKSGHKHIARALQIDLLFDQVAHTDS